MRQDSVFQLATESFETTTQKEEESIQPSETRKTNKSLDIYHEEDD
jgi:hypothetical protein